MIVKRPRILGGFLAQNPEFDSFSIDLIKEMLKSDVEKLSKANGRENTQYPRSTDKTICGLNKKFCLDMNWQFS